MEREQISHRVYVGKTQFGKTYKAVRDASKFKEYGKLFINLIDPKSQEGYSQVNCKTPIALIENMLKNHRKVQYNANVKTFDKEIIKLCEIVESIGKTIIIQDEVHLIEGYKNGKKALKQLRDVATGGRHKGNYVWSISQRPQLVDRTLLTQSTLYVFYLGFEDSWLKTYGVKTTDIPTKKYEYIEIAN